MKIISQWWRNHKKKVQIRIQIIIEKLVRYIEKCFCFCVTGQHKYTQSVPPLGGLRVIKPYDIQMINLLQWSELVLRICSDTQLQLLEKLVFCSNSVWTLECAVTSYLWEGELPGKWKQFAYFNQQIPRIERVIIICKMFVAADITLKDFQLLFSSTALISSKVS